MYFINTGDSVLKKYHLKSPTLDWCAALTCADTWLPLTFAPTMFVSPPDTIVTPFAAFTCVLFCIAASEFASPCALDIDAEEALRAANAKFERRFRHMESLARSRDLRLEQLSPSEWDALWVESKRQP